MNLGNIGKVLANQAMETTKKSVIDAVIPPDPKSKVAEPAAASKPPAAPDISSVILGQIQAMQRSLRDDQELEVTLTAAQEILRVSEIFVPHSTVIVFSGLDHPGNVTRVILPADQVQLMCKILPVMPGHTARRINIIPPRPPVSAPPSPAPAPHS